MFLYPEFHEESACTTRFAITLTDSMIVIIECGNIRAVFCVFAWPHLLQQAGRCHGMYACAIDPQIPSQFYEILFRMTKTADRPGAPWPRHKPGSRADRDPAIFGSASSKWYSDIQKVIRA